MKTQEQDFAPHTDPIADPETFPRQAQRRRSKLLFVLAIAAIGEAVYFLGIAPRIRNQIELHAAAKVADQIIVTTAYPTDENSQPPIVLPGNLEANQQTSIYARVDGYIKKWYVDIGAKVTEGQVLAEIDSPQEDANLRMAQAQLELADANYKLAQTNSRRSSELFQNHVNSQQELDTVLAAEQVQKANRDNAAAALQNAEQMKAYELIRAPFAGVISNRYIDVGTLVTSGSNTNVHKLYDLVQSDPIRVYVRVPQAHVNTIKIGNPASITIDEFPGETFTGKIARFAGALDPASRTILVEIDVSNPEGRLYSGMFSSAHLELPSPFPILVVPDNSILIDNQGSRIAVVDSSDTVRFKKVQLGRDYGTKSEILSGLDPHDRIVQNPSDALKEGMKVHIAG